MQSKITKNTIIKVHNEIVEFLKNTTRGPKLTSDFKNRLVSDYGISKTTITRIKNRYGRYGKIIEEFENNQSKDETVVRFTLQDGNVTDVVLKTTDYDLVKKWAIVEAKKLNASKIKIFK